MRADEHIDIACRTSASGIQGTTEGKFLFIDMNDFNAEGLGNEDRIVG